MQSTTQERIRHLKSVHHEAEQLLRQRISDGQQRNGQLMESNAIHRHNIHSLCHCIDSMIKGEVEGTLKCMLDHIVRDIVEVDTPTAAPEDSTTELERLSKEAERLQAELQVALRAAEQAKATANESERTTNRVRSEAAKANADIEQALTLMPHISQELEGVQAELQKVKDAAARDKAESENAKLALLTAQEEAERDKTADGDGGSGGEELSSLDTRRSIRSRIIAQHSQSSNLGAVSTSNPWIRLLPATQAAKALYNTFSQEEKELYDKFMGYFTKLLNSYNEASRAKKSDVKVDNNIQTVREKLHIITVAIFCLCTGEVFESREIVRDMFPNDFNSEQTSNRSRDRSRDRIRDLYQRLCKELSVKEKDLGIVPLSKGLVLGGISWDTQSGVHVDCANGAVALPNCALVSGLRVVADAIVYLEKDGHNKMMESTNDDRKSKYAFISGKGSNGPNERAMVKLAWEATGKKHPVLCIVDPNGSGYKMVQLLENEVTVQVVFTNETLDEYGVHESNKRATTDNDLTMIDNMTKTSNVINEEMENVTWGNLDQCLSLVNHSLGKIYLDVMDKGIKANESKWYLKQEQMEVEEEGEDE